MNRSNDSSRTVAELRDELLGFTHPSAVRRIASAVRSADEVQALYALLSAGEEALAYRAAWTLCHLAPTWDAVLRVRYDELVAAALDCPHTGRRRLLLALLYRQPQPEPLRVDRVSLHELSSLARHPQFSEGRALAALYLVRDLLTQRGEFKS